MKPSRRPGWAAFYLVVAALCGIQFYRNNLFGLAVPRAEIAVLALVVIGISELLRHQSWSRWANAGLKLLLGGEWLYRSGLTHWSSAIAAAWLCLDGVTSFVTWHANNRQSNDESEDERINSIVLLFKEPRYLDQAIVCRLASEAWAVDVLPAPDDDADAEQLDGRGSHDSNISAKRADSAPAKASLSSGPEPDQTENSQPTVYGETAPFMCLHWPALLLIHNVDKPYFEDVDDVASTIPDPRVADAVRSHTAWIAVDLLKWFGDDQESGRRNADRLIGQFLAELMDDDCVAVLDVLQGSVYPADPETEEKLRSGTPHESLAELYYAPMVSVLPDDTDIQQAVDTARSRWPEFVAAFDARDDTQHFSVKARFEEDDNVEFIWLTVTAIEGDAIYGQLGNEPHAIQRIKLGRVDIAL